MAKICPVSNKTSMMAGGYSNSVRATKYNPVGKSRKQPNMQKKKIFIPELGKSMSFTISTGGWKTVAKNGAFRTLKKAGLI